MRLPVFLLGAAACSRVYPVRVTQLDGEIFIELRSRTDPSGFISAHSLPGGVTPSLVPPIPR